MPHLVLATDRHPRTEHVIDLGDGAMRMTATLQGFDDWRQDIAVVELEPLKRVGAVERRPFAHLRLEAGTEVVHQHALTAEHDAREIHFVGRRRSRQIVLRDEGQPGRQAMAVVHVQPLIERVQLGQLLIELIGAAIVEVKRRVAAAKSERGSGADRRQEVAGALAAFAREQHVVVPGLRHGNRRA